MGRAILALHRPHLGGQLRTHPSGRALREIDALILQDVIKIIQELTELKITTFLVEQNSAMGHQACSPVCVCSAGKNTCECLANEPMADDEHMQNLLCV